MLEPYKKLRLMWIGPAIFSLLLGAAFCSSEQRLAAATVEPVAAREAQPSPEPKASEQPQESEAQNLHLLVGRSLVVTSPSRI